MTNSRLRYPSLLTLTALSLVSLYGCGSGKSDNTIDGGGDNDGGPTDAVGTQFAADPTQWSVPVAGDVNHGLRALSVQDGFEHINDTYYELADMDGDGLTDLIETTVIRDVTGTESLDQTYDEPFGYGSSPHWRFHRNNGSGFERTGSNWTLPVGGRATRGFNRWSSQPDNTQLKFTDGWNVNAGDQAWFVEDMDGDRKPDLVVTGQGAELVQFGYIIQQLGTDGAPKWLVYKNTGSGFATTASDWVLPPGFEGDRISGVATRSNSRVDSRSEDHWDLVDMNGDGRPDLVSAADVVAVDIGQDLYKAQVVGHPGTPHWRVYTNDGTGFAAGVMEWSLPFQRGYMDTGLLSLAGSASVDGEDIWQLLDLNGDQKPDLVFTGFQGSESFKSWNYPGDASWQWYANSGTAFAATPAAWLLPLGGTGVGGFHSAASGAGAVPGDDAWFTRDMDGDGRADLVVTSEFVAGDGSTQGVYGFGKQSGDPHWRFHRNNGTRFEMSVAEWSVPMGGLIKFGFNGAAGTAGGDIGDYAWGLVELNGDHQPDLVIPSTLVDDPLNAGMRTPRTFNVGTEAPYWRVYLSTP